MQLYRYFMSQYSEFCRHSPLRCFSTSVYCCLFRYDSVRKLLDTPSYCRSCCENIWYDHTRLCLCFFPFILTFPLLCLSVIFPCIVSVWRYVSPEVNCQCEDHFYCKMEGDPEGKHLVHCLPWPYIRFFCLFPSFYPLFISLFLFLLFYFSVSFSSFFVIISLSLSPNKRHTNIGWD